MQICSEHDVVYSDSSSVADPEVTMGSIKTSLLVIIPMSFLPRCMQTFLSSLSFRNGAFGNPGTQDQPVCSNLHSLRLSSCVIHGNMQIGLRSTASTN
jgi:hypothetical protein